MARQVLTAEEFLKLVEGASECRVVRKDGEVKLKIRRTRRLYSFVTTEEEANRLLQGLKVPIVEF